MAQKLAMATRGKQVPTHDLCYFAGVLDSDGCISIAKGNAGIQRTKNPRYVFTMNITNTNEDLMKWLVQKLGGSYYASYPGTEKHRITYRWWLNNGGAIWLLRLVEPLLIVKRKQAKIGIDLLENWKTNQGMGAKTSPKEVFRRERCYQKMRRLNQVGPVQPQRLNPVAPAQKQGDAIV